MYKLYSPDEKIEFNDVYFICFMIERVARKQHLQNFEVLRYIAKEELHRLLSLADVLHCDNFDKTADEWIKEYNIPQGNYHFDDVDPELDVHIPSDKRIGKVFAKLIIGVTENTIADDLLGSFYNVYNNPITEKINNYNCSAFYEPSFVQLRAYYNQQF